MESSLTFGRFVRNLLLLAGLGFLVVVFSGPVLAVAGMVLSFALIGFLLWLPMHTLVFGRRAPLRQTLDRSRELSAQALAGVGAGCRQVGRVRRHLGAQLRAGVVAVSPLLLEVGCGAVLGVLLVWAYGGAKAEPETFTAGALAGAVVGALIVVRAPVAGRGRKDGTGFPWSLRW